LISLATSCLIAKVTNNITRLTIATFAETTNNKLRAKVLARKFDINVLAKEFDINVLAREFDASVSTREFDIEEFVNVCCCCSC